jgi:hypothetical protein
MASSYSTDLKLELMVTGEKAGLWGDITNTNLNIVSQAIAGYESVTLNATTGATLAFTNGAISNGKNAVLDLAGTITGNVDVIIPDGIEKNYIVKNSTSGAFTVTLKTTSGSGVTWGTTDKGTKAVYSDGTDVVDTGFVSQPVYDSFKFNNASAITDENDLEQIKFSTTASAVNEIQVKNAATGNAPAITATGDDTNINLELAGKGTGVITSGSSAVKVAGKETIWVPATAMYAATTNGAAAGQAELTAGNPELKTFDFDPTTAESVQFNVCFPKSWNEGTITYQTFWSASSTDTGTGGYKLSGVSIADDADYDTAFGTAIANTAKAASGTQDDLIINDESGAVTIASAAADTNTILKLERNVATDTNTGDLRLVGVKIFYTTDAANDA